MRRILPVLLVLIPLAGVVAEELEEVVEHFPSGAVRAKYTVDAEGRRQGNSVEYHEDGKLRVRCRYRSGALHGAYSSFHPNRKRHVTAKYKDGKLSGSYTERGPDGATLLEADYELGLLHGERRFFSGKNVLSEQRWERGRLVFLDGFEVFARTRESISETLARIRAKPDEPEGDALASDRGEALRILRAYRYLVGVPWEDVVLDPELNDLAQAGARLCAKIGRLDHTPENPGLPEEEYQRGYRGTSQSNLGGGTAAESVHGFMDDSDPSNLEKLGHRSWCVHPPLRKTGFGAERGFTAMWATDSSRPVPFDMVRYPPSGYVPVGYFSPTHAWSVWPNPARYGEPNPARVKVEVRALDDEYLAVDPPLELQYFRAGRTPYGVGRLVVFRPKGVRVEPGSRYLVRITGLGKERKPDELRYVVEFF